MQRANKHMKICSTSLIIKEIQSTIIMRYYFILIRIATIYKSIYIEKITSFGKEIEEMEILCVPLVRM